MTTDPIYILRGVGGSHAHGLAKLTSDIDLIGVISYPTEAFFSLVKPAASIVQHDPQDVSYHELEKFLSLAAKSNPTVLETVWLDSYLEKEMNWGDELINIRSSFASAHYVLKAFVGYAESQFRKMMTAGDEKARARSPKNAVHMLRLMEQGRALYTTGELPIAVENPDLYREWETWRTEPLSREFTRQWELFVESVTVLPEEPDWNRINDYLRSYRKAHL